ncbi:MAG TPA: histidine kinase [Alphaproteobacteria bacterium]|nr:histidine kinase [Alphaproteobacteria bacterium]HAM48486.1 histidine kinase [Alphaproteobacteria bacterium]HBA43753.1 histidine kinase [Alphaproteobacteria bacterium]HBC52699.1 histidine kinase [Alphaproteobacteria bacterium]
MTVNVARDWRKFFSRRARKRGPVSPLTRQILAVNFVGLGLFAAGALYLNQFRSGLIETRIQSLITQAEIIAGAIAQTSARGPAATRVNPVIAAQIARRIVLPTQTRARLFNVEGTLVVDSRDLVFPRPVRSYALPQPGQEAQTTQSWIVRLEQRYARMLEWLFQRERPLYHELESARASDYPEVLAALQGNISGIVRKNSQGEPIISVAVPVQRFRVVLGGLMLTTEAADIDEIVRAERRAIIEVFLVALAVATVMSLVTAGAIVRPIRRLAEAADRVRLFKTERAPIPDMSRRNDEVGDLSVALIDMTSALYDRIDAIERFAADVAHEIKNPLTSISSAIESLAVARDEASKAKLMAIIHNDVRRMDRLISDISAASRLDAQLSRAKPEPVPIVPLLRALVDLFRETQEKPVTYQLRTIGLNREAEAGLVVRGEEGRLVQVFRNLLENAVSFSPEGGTITVLIRREADKIVVVIEDEGVGFPISGLERVFERFYTDRPDMTTGDGHSGLGLSISRQIVEAYGGTIEAENRYAVESAAAVDTEPQPIGARLIVKLRPY